MVCVLFWLYGSDYAELLQKFEDLQSKTEDMHAMLQNMQDKEVCF